MKTTLGRNDAEMNQGHNDIDPGPVGHRELVDSGGQGEQGAQVLSNYNNLMCSCLRLLCRFFLTFRDAAFFRVLASLGAKFAMRQAILLNLRTLQE